MSDLYQMTPADHLERSLIYFEEHALELLGNYPTMTPQQQKAFIEICSRIAGMEQRDAA